MLNLSYKKCILKVITMICLASFYSCRKKSLNDLVCWDDISTIEKAIKSGMDIEQRDTYGLTPLHHASASGRIDVIELLLRYGAKVNCKNDFGWTPLHSACSNSNISPFSYQAVGLLILKGADINAKADDGLTPLGAAADGGNPEVVKLLLDNRADVNSSPLFWIAKNTNPKVRTSDKEKIVKMLLKAGAYPMKESYQCTPLELALSHDNNSLARIMADSIDVNKKSSAGAIPIHYAIRRGSPKMVKFLLDYGCDFNIKDDSGRTPLNVAKSNEDRTSIEIIKLLEEKGAIDEGISHEGGIFIEPTEDEFLKEIKEMIASGKNINQKSDRGQTEVHRASFRGYVKVLEFLIKNNADINIYDEDGYSPLHYAILRGKFTFAKLLIENGAEVNGKNKKTGETALHYAVTEREAGVVDFIKFLLEHGADINIQDENGNTPLHRAVKQGNVTTTKFLIEEKADLNIPDKIMRYTPLHTACQWRNKEIVEALLNHGAEVNARDRSGFTPLVSVYPSMESEPNEAAIADILLKHGGKTFGVERMIK